MIGWPRQQLGALTPIDSDAMTHRYAVGRRLPDLPAPLWYREIRPDHELPDHVTAQAIRRAFQQAVAARERCSATDRARLDARTDWPLAVVTDRDVVVGVVQPGLPPEFWLPGNQIPGSGTPGDTATTIPSVRPMTLRHLCASDEAAQANGIDRSAVDGELARLALATHLAFTIHLLHRNRLAYSDLTLDRVAIAGPPPRTMLIGCDPTVPLTTPNHDSYATTSSHDSYATTPNHDSYAATQNHDPDATVPDGGSSGTASCPDPGRLALCVIRALAKGPGATQLTDPARVGSLLGRPGVDLFTRALAPPPVQRPSIEQMYKYLSVRLAELAREPGPVELATALPGFDLVAHLRGTLPRLAVPGLPTVAAAPGPAPLPHRPMVGTEAHPPPRIELPGLDLGPLTHNPAADGPAAVSSVLAHAYVDANQLIAATLDRGLRTLREAIDGRLPARQPSRDLGSNQPGRPHPDHRPDERHQPRRQASSRLIRSGRPNRSRRPTIPDVQTANQSRTAKGEPRDGGPG